MSSKLQCPFCQKLLSTADALRRHKSKRRKTGKCPRVLPKRQPSRFTTNKEGVVGISCEVCQKSFASNAGLTEHLKKYNGECSGVQNWSNFYSVNILEDGTQTFSCKMCTKATYSRYSGIWEHVKTFKKTGKCSKVQKHKVVMPPQCLKCPHCEHIFKRKDNFDNHMSQADPILGCQIVQHIQFQINSFQRVELNAEGETILRCTLCKEIFYNRSSIDSHLTESLNNEFKCPRVQLLKGESMQPFKVDRLKSKNPFAFEEVRTEIPYRMGSPEHSKELDNLCEWIKTAKAYKHQTLRNRFHGVYIVAVLDRKLDVGKNLKEIFQSNPTQVVGVYFGSCSHSSSRISSRHVDRPESSILAKAALAGHHIILLDHLPVKDEFADRLARVKALEAYLIEQAFVDAEYIPKLGQNQFPLLNSHRETANLMSVPEKNQKKLYENAIKGFNLLCFETDCNGDCDAECHVEWESNLILDLKSKILAKHPNLELEDFIPMATTTPQRKRPSNELEVLREVERRMKKLEALRKNYDPTYYVYTVIVVKASDFPNIGEARQIVKEIIRRKDENLNIGVYVGVNGEPKPSDYHTDEYKVHSSIYKAVQNGGVAIVVDVHKCPNRMEAREREATAIAYNSILQRWKTDGVKFNLLNMQQEWSHLPAKTEDFKEDMGHALAGHQYLVLDKGVGLINLKSQLLRGQVEMMKF